MKGGYFNISNGVTLTINGPIEAGPWQILAWTGTGAVNLDGCPTKTFYLENWGALSGIANDIQPYLLKMAASGVHNKIIKVTKANWRLATPIQFTDPVGFTLEGEDAIYSNIYLDVGATNNAMTFGVAGYGTVAGTDAAVGNYWVKNLSVTGQANCCRNGLVFSRVINGGTDQVTVTVGAAEYAVVQAACSEFSSYWRIGQGKASNYGTEFNGITLGRAANGVRVTTDYAGNTNAGVNTLKIIKDTTYTAAGGYGLRLESVGNNFVISGSIQNCPGLPGYGVYGTSCTQVRFKDLYLKAVQQGVLFEDSKELEFDGIYLSGSDADGSSSGWASDWVTSGGTINSTGNCPYPQNLRLSNCNNVTIRNADLGQLEMGATCRGVVIESASVSQRNGLLDYAPDTQYLGTVSFRDGSMPKQPFTPSGFNTVNYFPNSMFDRWQTSQPDYWPKSGTMSWTKCGVGLTNLTQHMANFCAKFSCTAQESPGFTMSTDILNGLRGNMATFSMWMMPGTGQTFTDTAAWVMSLQADVPPWMPNKLYQPGDAVCSNYMYLHPQQTDLVLATPGLYIRGVTSGAYGLICKRDDTNKYIYIDRNYSSATPFAAGETLKLTANGKSTGDTGISYTNEATNGSYTITQKSMFICEWGGTSAATEPAWDTAHGATPQTDSTCTWRYIPNKVDTSVTQPASDPTHGYQVGTWRKYICTQYIPRTCWQLTPGWTFKPSQSGSGAFYLAEPVLNVGSQASRGVLPAGNEVPTAFYIGGCKFDRGTAAPIDGSWCNVGDTRFNSAPAAGGTPGWVCTTSGTAGGTAVWKAMGNLGS